MTAFDVFELIDSESSFIGDCDTCGENNLLFCVNYLNDNLYCCRQCVCDYKDIDFELSAIATNF